MTQSIRLRRDGDRIVMEDRERSKDHSGVLSSVILSVEDAAWLADVLRRMALDIKEGRPG